MTASASPAAARNTLSKETPHETNSVVRRPDHCARRAFYGGPYVTASTAAVTTGLGDLSSLKTIVADVQAKVAAGDMQGAAARVTDWETAWDHGQTAIRPLNATYWGNIDAASDAALSSVRAKPATPDAAKAARSSLMAVLIDPSKPAP